MVTVQSKEIIVSSMSVAELAEKLDIPVNSLILSLLRQGIVAVRNQALPESVVASVAETHGFVVIKPTEKSGANLRKSESLSEGTGTERMPVVVVIGHVDHGKTTLLDFIRKTRVAAREKGGITQHLGAYQAKTAHGAIVFIDTPGHEAFSMMRARGITVADIAILIVAADDGIKPQTVEALKRAQQAEVPIVVAINKVDKVTEKQIEAVKSQLAQYNLVPEDWGGQTVCMPISALTGQGIDELLEVIILQSQMMSLAADLNVPASGYVLESRLEKGRGPVATVICQHGVMRVGDFFSCGATQGRVSSLHDYTGKSIKQANPSQPVLVAGFAALPKAGDVFKVGHAKDIKREVASAIVPERQQVRSAQINKQSSSLVLIVKTDTDSSLEALLGAVKKMSGKVYSDLQIISAGIGSITESDIALADDTNALVYGLHTKMEPNAASAAQRLKVDVRIFDIIYKLLEDLQEAAEKNRPVVMKQEKTGEAQVLKVFDIKNLGIVAGARIMDGYCARTGNVVIYRNKKRVGSGKITSLQRERNSVKEVRKGFECAFMVDNFTEWEVDDRVECFIEVAASNN